MNDFEKKNYDLRLFSFLEILSQEISFHPNLQKQWYTTGEILSFLLTHGNISDVAVLEELSKGISGKLFGDKGYISSEMSKKLLEKGIELFTTLRKNMKQKMLSLKDLILLRKCVLIETVNDQLKNISQIEHSRYRSPSNFVVNVLGGLAAYTRRPNKTCIKFDDLQRDQLMALCC